MSDQSVVNAFEERIQDRCANISREPAPTNPGRTTVAGLSRCTLLTHHQGRRHRRGPCMRLFLSLNSAPHRHERGLLA